MRKVLLVAAIYSLIVNQCCKNDGVKSLGIKGSHEAVAKIGSNLLRLMRYQQNLLSHTLTNKNAGMITIMKPAAYVKTDRK